MRNIALKLMYNGTAYHGWQVQKTVSSVCETMEKGLAKVCGGPVKLVGCGRTDAGVHAERYIANFHTDSRIPVERLPCAVDTHTPEDIVVREALEVADDFNAILSCQKKEYTYRIFNSRIKNPFYVNRAYFYPKHLDEEVMDRAARAFEGTHDFKAVRSVGTETKTTVRTCTTAAWRARAIFWSSRSARTDFCITWYGPSPAPCSTRPRASSRPRISPRSLPPATARWPAPRCRPADCT